MKKFKEQLDEATDSNSALLNYITASFYKMASTDNTDLKPMILLLAATVMSLNPDAKSTSMARRLAQLAVSKNKPDGS